VNKLLYIHIYINEFGIFGVVVVYFSKMVIDWHALWWIN